MARIPRRLAKRLAPMVIVGTLLIVTVIITIIAIVAVARKSRDANLQPAALPIAAPAAQQWLAPATGAVRVVTTTSPGMSPGTRVQPPVAQQMIERQIRALVDNIGRARQTLYGSSGAQRPSQTRILVYVNGGDNKLAPVTPGFDAAARAFIKARDRTCWSLDAPKASTVGVFYSADYHNDAVAQLQWASYMTSFFADIVAGDSLVFLILTHGGINQAGVEFLLGDMDEKSLTAVAQKLPPKVSLFVYTSGCEQSSPVETPHHITVDSGGRRMAYPQDDAPVTFDATVVTLTDTWHGYAGQFEPAQFPVPKFSTPSNPAFTAILLNFLMSRDLSSVRTYDDLFRAYAESGWHRLRGDDVPPGTSETVKQNIMSGVWNMFRPVLGMSSPSLLQSSCSHWAC